MNVFMDSETWTLGSLRRLTGCTTGDESCFHHEVEKTIIECLIFKILKLKECDGWLQYYLALCTSANPLDCLPTV